MSSKHGDSTGHEPANARGQIDAFKTGWSRSDARQASQSVRFWAERLEQAETEEDSRYYLTQLDQAARWLYAEVQVEKRKRGSQKTNGAAPVAPDAKGKSQALVRDVFTGHMQPCDCEECWNA